MSHSIDRKISLRKQATGALERIEVVEKSLTDIVKGVNNALGTIDKSVQDLQRAHNESLEIIDAVIGLVGLDQVQAVVAQARNEKALAKYESEKQDLEKGVAEGRILVAEAIGEKTVLHASETNADGTVRPPGGFFIAFEAIDKKYQDLLIGKGVGTSIDTEPGGKFTVQSVYKLNPDWTAPAEAPAAAPVEVPVEAPVEAPAATEPVAT